MAEDGHSAEVEEDVVEAALTLPEEAVPAPANLRQRRHCKTACIASDRSSKQVIARRLPSMSSIMSRRLSPAAATQLQH